MAAYVALAAFGGVGFAAWIGIVKLWELYEERTPPHVQTHIYTTAKNLPRNIADIVLSCILWCGLGAMLLRLVLGLVGLDSYLPSTSWAPGVVAFFVAASLLVFWGGPERTEPIQPRGRGLTRDAKNNSTTSAARKKTPAAPTRGRTIRSYHDIK